MVGVPREGGAYNNGEYNRGGTYAPDETMALKWEYEYQDYSRHLVLD